MLAALIGILAQIQPLEAPGWAFETGPWRFNPGDSAVYAAPGYRDAAWPIVSVPGPWPASAGGGVGGLGWYRVGYRVRLLPQEPMALSLQSVSDAYELYVDGRLVGSLGVLPPGRRERTDVMAFFALPMAAQQPGEHVVALRVHSGSAHGGIVGPVRIEVLRQLRMEARKSDQTLLATALLLLGIGVHQTFFWLRRQQAREHLFIFLSCVALAGFFVSWMPSAQLWLSPWIHWYRLHLAAAAACLSAFSAALRRVFQVESDRALRWLAGCFAALAVLELALPEYDQLRTLGRFVADPGALAWAAVIGTMAVRQSRSGAPHAAPFMWGAGVMFAATLYQVMTDWGVPHAPSSSWIVLVGSVAFVASLAMTTAHRFVDTETAALYDRLTGLYRREVVMDALGREIHRSTRFRQPVSVIMLDLDRFKQVNDTLGHQAGDRVLAEVGRRLAAAGRAVDWLGRYGGEEFLGVLAATGLEGARRAAERLRTAVSALPIEAGRASRSVTLSAGVAAYEVSDHSPTAEQLVGAADAALYRAKHAGRDCVMS